MTHKKFWLLNVVGAAVLAAGWMHGPVRDLIVQDQTGMVWVLLTITLLGLVSVRLERWHDVRFLYIALPLLGLLGTIIGLKMAMAGVAGSDISLRDLGVDVALNTTIAGIVGSLWLKVNEHLIMGRMGNDRV